MSVSSIKPGLLTYMSAVKVDFLRILSAMLLG